MYKTLAPDCIGHRVGLEESAPLAEKYGFKGIWFNIEREARIPVEKTKEILNKHHLKAAGFGLPVEYRKDEETFRKDMEKLEEYAAYARDCGMHRCITWIIPASDELTYEETLNKMTALYDGYHFCEFAEGVFNPFSVLNVFDGYKFSNYWFQTGTPTFLVELLKKSEYDLRTLIDGVEANASSFMEYRVDANNPIPLIYQSGYLTIKGYDKRFGNYLLKFPNDEVRYGFMDFLVPYYTSVVDDERGFYLGKFVRELESGDVDAFLTRLQAFFADFPYELNEKTERHYQVVFYLVFKLMGQFTGAEVRSARGRADAVVKTPKYIYVFEFKLNGTAEQALQQIDEKGYLIPYQVDGRELVKVGVEFSAEKRNIDRWLY